MTVYQQTERGLQLMKEDRRQQRQQQYAHWRRWITEALVLVIAVCLWVYVIAFVMQLVSG